MKFQENTTVKSKVKKITAVNIACRDCRIIALELIFRGVKSRVGIVWHYQCELPDDRLPKNIEVDPRCRDCNIYEGMDW
jgi:hypothetical protein